MDDKTLEEIKARTEEAEEEGLGLEQLDDLNTLIAEAERLKKRKSRIKSKFNDSGFNNSEWWQSS